VTGALGGGAAVNADGSITAPAYIVGGQTVNTVGAAITHLDGLIDRNATGIQNVGDALITTMGRVTKNETDITNITNSLSDDSIGLVQQDAGTNMITVAKDKAGDLVDFTGTDGVRTLSGVKAGTLSATSSEAVNGSLLYATNQGVAQNASDIAGLDGRVTQNTTDIGGMGTRITQNETNITAIDNRVTNVEGSVQNITNDLNSGVVGLVQQDAGTNMITVAKDKAGDLVDFTGTDGVRTLSGVKAGTLSDTSSEAVNGSQLYATNQSVAQNASDIARLDGRVTQNTTDIGGMATRITQNETNITAIDNRVTNVEGSVQNITNDLNSGVVGLVQQDAGTNAITVAQDKAGDLVDFTGTAGSRKLTGVANGNVAAGSTDAVNGDQLNTTNQTVAQNTADIVNNRAEITNLSSQLASGQMGLVQQDAATGAIMVAANTGGSMVNIAGTDGPRTLAGVANGVSDTDAATVAQLKATGLVDYTGKALAAVVYDDLTLSNVTFGGVNGTVIDNVRAGLIGADSMQAVNGGQLYSDAAGLRYPLLGPEQSVLGPEQSVLEPWRPCL
jgi:hypothetical protein